MDITNRDIINSLSNEDLADCLLHDDSDFKEATSTSINEWLNKKVDENS